MHAHFNNLCDRTILKLHRLYSQVLREPWGYRRFPNGGQALAKLEEVMEQRIPADHIEQIEKLQLYINSRS